jgi:hypothetical protein
MKAPTKEHERKHNKKFAKSSSRRLTCVILMSFWKKFTYCSCSAGSCSRCVHAAPSKRRYLFRLVLKHHGTLRGHKGVKFLYECVMGMRKHEGHGCILADEM